MDQAHTERKRLDHRPLRGATGGGGDGMAPIIEHADIRRSLLTMKALTQAARAICLVTAKETDVARRAKDADFEPSLFIRTYTKLYRLQKKT